MKEKKKWKKVGKIVLGICLAFFLVFLIWWLFLEKFYLFHKSEKRVEDAARDYYQLNEKRLPDKALEVSTVSLQTLYEEKWVDSIYIPRSKTLCNSDDSWVKVRKEKDGNYKYYVYLSCGKFSSNVDHEGPEITLNGRDEITVSRGSTYEELGVKSVIDATDKKMDASLVKIDSSNVDTSKLGDYEVTYTVSDSFHNKTVKKRKVTVIQVLNELVQSSTNGTGLYQGPVENNYLQFSGMLFRIVKEDDDKHIQIVTEENISNINYGFPEYEKSNVRKWLNEYFYQHLSSSAKKFLVKGEFCTDMTSDATVQRDVCEKAVSDYVGQLTIDDYNRTLIGGTYLNNHLPYAFMTKLSDTEVYSFHPDKGYAIFSFDRLLPVRPVLYLKEGLKVVAGDGTRYNPYRLEDYTYAKASSLLKDRLSGEFIHYAGHLFRIIEVEKDGSIKVVMDDIWKDENDKALKPTYENDTNQFVFKVDEVGNLGYIINQHFTQYLPSKLIVPGEFRTTYLDNGLYYDQLESISYKATFAVPDTYEMFSSKSTSTDYNNFWLRNASKSDGVIVFVTTLGTPIEITYRLNRYNGVRLVTRFRSDTQIISGKGLREDPYYVK